ncbi:uncharacterized protein LOC114260325 isoform X2 [Camellia sinensis]|uniref:uncharacterized protein LOC114260325 isoform X2 n=1 Tax=Camellia sinensis TaxID=4442 RepID=UPI0010357623|nr:uncharacterized protein LOC114260325 isoform X2 [Camellia sinensis]
MSLSLSLFILLISLFSKQKFNINCRYFCSIGIAFRCVQGEREPVFQECFSRIYCWFGPYYYCHELVSSYTKPEHPSDKLMKNNCERTFSPTTMSLASTSASSPQL